MKAKDIMTLDLITVNPETDIVTAAGILFDKHINGVPVVDTHNVLLGILCQSDLIAQQKKLPIPSFFALFDGFIPLGSSRTFDKEIEKITALTVEHAMTKDVITVTPDTELDEIASIMVDKKIHTLPVIDTHKKVIGIIGKEDILKTLLKK